MRLLIGTTILALAGPPTSPPRENVDPEIGKTYIGHPKANCSSYEGFVLRANKIELITTSGRCGSNYEAWLSKSVGQEDGGPRRMMVLDHLVVSDLKEGDELSSAPYCYQGTQPLQWVGLYRWNHRMTITRANGGVRAAWTVNVSLGRFEQASSKLLDEAKCNVEAEE